MEEIPQPVAVIIVNWNGFKDTIACLASLLVIPGFALRIYVCDNGSTDNSIPEILKWANQAGLPEAPQHIRISTLPYADPTRFLTIIQVGANVGFAAANNIGMRLALKCPNLDLLWLLNNDTEVEPDSLRQMVLRIAEDPQIGICGATLVYAQTPSVVQAVGVHFNLALAGGYLIGNGLPLEMLPSREEVEHKTTYIPGACMLLRRRFLEEVGMMDESYFLYCEELDWALRNAHRFRQAWAPGSIVRHKEGASIGTSSRQRPSNLSMYYQCLSTLRLLRRFRPLYLPAGIIRAAVKAARFLLQGDVSGCITIGRSLLDFAAGRVPQFPKPS